MASLRRFAPAPPIKSMRVTVGPCISGRRGSARWRWMRIISQRHPLCLTQSRARSPGIGRGRACACILQSLAGRYVRTTNTAYR